MAAPPVRFRRPASMLAIPVPERGGSIAALGQLFNISNPDNFVLVVAWFWRPCARMDQDPQGAD